MSLEELLELLRSTGIPFAEAGWDEAPDCDYGTVRYRAFDPQFADDKVVYIEQEATVILQSRGKGENSKKLIQEKLRTVEDTVTWWLESVDYSTNTGHNVWIWGILL